MKPPADTTPEAWELFLDIHRRMTPAEKFQRTVEWSELARSFMESGIRERHPGAGDREVLLRYARLTMGPELFRTVYGDALADYESVKSNA